MAYTQLFTQRFGYALHALCYLARRPHGELTTAPELTRWMKSFWPTTSETYLVSVIQRLVRSGLIRSHRGKLGGYSLSRDPTEITVRDVLTHLEGRPVTQCSLAPDGECPVHVGCGMLRRLKALEETFLEILEGVTIAELAQGLGVDIPAQKAGDDLLPVVS